MKTNMNFVQVYNKAIHYIYSLTKIFWSRVDHSNEGLIPSIDVNRGSQEALYVVQWADPRCKQVLILSSWPISGNLQ